MDGDEMFDLECLFIETCGLSYKGYARDKSILTQYIFESHFKAIMDIVKGRVNNHFPYLCLGYFILKTGSYLPEDVQQVIVEHTDYYKYEVGYWDTESWTDEDRTLRRICLRDLKVKIENHVQGRKVLLVEEGHSN